MKLWIPKCGDSAVLDRDWSFKLHDEHRNEKFWRAYTPSPAPDPWNYRTKQKPLNVTLLVGTELVFDRVYIRQKADEFASVTFIIAQCANENLIGERFWAKLDDVNNIEFSRGKPGNTSGFGAAGRYKALAKQKKDPALAAKAAKAKEAREDLKLAREAVPPAARDKANFAHVDKIAREVIKQLTSVRMHGAWSPGVNDVRTRMMSSYCTGDWACYKTRKNADGSVERDFFHVWYVATQVGGFTVTTKDGKVTSVVPLVKP